MRSNPNPQLSSATALAQLLTEYPDLPVLRWSIGPDGQLSGAAFDRADLDADASALLAVLGGQPLVTRHEPSDADPWVSVQFSSVWRDVRFFVTVGGPAERTVLVPSSVRPADGTIVRPVGVAA